MSQTRSGRRLVRSASSKTRSVRLSVRPDGAIYGYLVEQISSSPRRERVICWLGRSPSESRIRSACKQFNARLPKGLRKENHVEQF